MKNQLIEENQKVLNNHNHDKSINQELEPYAIDNYFNIQEDNPQLKNPFIQNINQENKEAEGKNQSKNISGLMKRVEMPLEAKYADNKSQNANFSSKNISLFEKIKALTDFDYKQIQIKVMSYNNHQKPIPNQFQDNFILSKNIDIELQRQRDLLYNNANEALNKFKISNCQIFLYGCLYVLIYPICILFATLFLGIFSGLLSLLLGCLLLLSIIFLPVFLILYFCTKSENKQVFYGLLISLSWISLAIILKGILTIIKSIFNSIFRFFYAFYLICKRDINHINLFWENIRVGLGNLKMKKINIVSKLTDESIGNMRIVRL